MLGFGVSVVLVSRSKKKRIFYNLSAPYIIFYIKPRQFKLTARWTANIDELYSIISLFWLR